MPRHTSSIRTGSGRARPQLAAQVRQSERDRRRARMSSNQSVGFRKGEKHATRRVGF